MANMTLSNPYLSRKNKSIVYNVVRTANGWQVEAVMPSKVPPSDRLKVLDWFKEYREQVRSAHPLWSTVFHPAEGRYTLDIRTVASNDKELMATGEALKSLCGEILDYA